MILRSTLVLALVLGYAGCGDNQQSVYSGQQAKVGENGPAATRSGETARQPKRSVSLSRRSLDANTDLISSADRAAFRRLAASIDGSEGLAVAAIGRVRRVYRLGSLRRGVAWSTAKVPVAMAMIAAGADRSERSDIKQAITASDNAAALRLWAELGGGKTAARATRKQLRRAGDRRTRIEHRLLRGPSYTPFGQTDWALTDQVRFVSGLDCLDQGVEVLGLMEKVIPAQRWGLGAAGVEAALKGGWGPGTRPGAAGGYFDRQIGVLTVRDRRIAVAIASVPSDGSHETGTRNLTRLARWLVAHVNTRGLPERAEC